MSDGEAMEKCSEKKHRDNLFPYLDDVIEVAHRKATAERGNRDMTKQGWARILISAIGTYGELLKDVELDQLEADITAIKTKLGMTT